MNELPITVNGRALLPMLSALYNVTWAEADFIHRALGTSRMHGFCETGGVLAVDLMLGMLTETTPELMPELVSLPEYRAVVDVLTEAQKIGAMYLLAIVPHGEKRG